MTYNFDNELEFFENSQIYSALKAYLDKEVEARFNKNVVDASLRLWAESVIKHNLSISMTSVDNLYLITHENSKPVRTTLGKIMAKSKDKKSSSDFTALSEQSRV